MSKEAITVLFPEQYPTPGGIPADLLGVLGFA